MTTKISVGGRPTQPGKVSKGSDPGRQPTSTTQPGAGAAAKITPSKAKRTPTGGKK